MKTKNERLNTFSRALVVFLAFTISIGAIVFATWKMKQLGVKVSVKEGQETEAAEDTSYLPAIWTSYFGQSGVNVKVPWGKTNRFSGFLSSEEAMLAKGDLVRTEQQGMGGRVLGKPFNDYMDAIETEMGCSGSTLIKTNFYDKYIYDLFTKNIIGLENKTSHKFYMQIGNEINLDAYYGPKITNWQEYLKTLGKKSRLNECLENKGKSPVNYTASANGRNAPAIIPIYVEYYLIPTISAIQRAEQSAGADIPVMIGSVAWTSEQASYDWFNKLLSYEIMGLYDKKYAGKKVADLVEIATIHYPFNMDYGYLGGHAGNLEQYRTRALAGNIKKLWITEDIGRCGPAASCGASAVKVFARYVDWFSMKRYIGSEYRALKPDESRTMFWGWWQKKGESINPDGSIVYQSGISEGKIVAGKEPLGRAGGAMEKILGFLGENKLSVLKNKVALTLEKGSISDAEIYLFQIEPAKNKRMVVIFPRNNSASLWIKSVSVKSGEWIQANKTLKTNEVGIFQNLDPGSGVNVWYAPKTDMSVSKTAYEYIFNFNTAIDLTGQKALVVFMDAS